MSVWSSMLTFLGLREPEQRRTLKEVDFWLNDVGWGVSTAAGVSVSQETALGVPEVNNAVELIAGDVGRCPLKLQEQVDGDWVDAEGRALWEILGSLPNPETTAEAFWGALVRDLLVCGHAYAEIVRDGVGRVLQIWRLDPSRMTVDREPGSLRKRYLYRLPGGEMKVLLFDPDKPPILDLDYVSPIQRCRDLIGLALGLDTYVAKFFANNARPSGVLRTSKPLNDDARQRLAAAWKAAYGGAANAHKVAVLEDDLQFQSISQDNTQAQLLELRRFVRTQIAGAFKVPPHKIGDLERATFSNIEQQDREYYSTALAPLFTKLAQAIRRDLLSTRQYPRYRVVWDYESLIQTDILSRMNGFSVGLQNGVYSPNDVRRKLGENPIPAAEGGNRYHMNGNMMPLTWVPQEAEPVATAEQAAEEQARAAVALAAQRAHELEVARAQQPVTNLTLPEIRVEAPAITVAAPPPPAVDIHVDAPTIQIDPQPVVKTLRHNDRGEIESITEVPVEAVRSE